MLSPPPLHSASEASQLPSGWTKIALTPSLIPAGRLRVSLHSIPATGCREGGGSSQQRFKGLGVRDAAPSLPPPAPGSAAWYPRWGGMQGTCAMKAGAGREGRSDLGLGREKKGAGGNSENTKTTLKPTQRKSEQDACPYWTQG